jgi:formylglycine-generating enzyme required for sulfatase activity
VNPDYDARSASVEDRWHILIHLLLLGIIGGLIGWINRSYLEAEINWFTTMRPYMLAQVRPYVLSKDAERALQPPASFRECARDCPEMIVVPAGKFMMGSPATEAGRFGNEGPQHKVTIARSFAVSKFDVTFAEWDSCVAVGGCRPTDDGGYGRDTNPVVFVSWDEAQQYAVWLSRMTGRPYRLLTEAEWEYAARAGTTTAYWWGDEIGKGNANCLGCGSEWDARQPAPVGSFKPNAFGLYDMHGNVWQWVQDCYHTSYVGAPTDGSAWIGEECSRHVVRGGSWSYPLQSIRAAYRFRGTPDWRYRNLGFRVGRTLGP